MALLFISRKSWGSERRRFLWTLLQGNKLFQIDLISFPRVVEFLNKEFDRTISCFV